MAKEAKHNNPLAPKFISDIIKQHCAEYRKSGKLEKKRLLDHLEQVTLRPRKSIIRTLNQQKQTKAFSTVTYSSEASIPGIPGIRGRPTIYTPEVDQALEYIWQAYDCPCAERLHPQITEAINIFKREEEWYYSDKATGLLRRMSLSTMRNHLVKLAKKHHLVRGISTTRASTLKSLVPTFHGDWQKMPVGYGQIDTVVHSGGKLLAPMVYTVSFIDMQTYWQEFHAQLEKTADVTLHSISTIEQRLPFPLVGLHPDSGDEFLNWSSFDWCHDPKLHANGKVDLTRSRPNKKNDNCNVEERNNHIVRKYVGYDRYDCQEAADAMNELYAVLRLYVNFFQPIQKLDTKHKLETGRYKRIYKAAMTPYERVLAHKHIAPEVKARLANQYEHLNPRKLLAKIKALTIKLQDIQKNQGYHG